MGEARSVLRRMPCEFFATGSCRDGGRCRFMHVTPPYTHTHTRLRPPLLLINYTPLHPRTTPYRCRFVHEGPRAARARPRAADAPTSYPMSLLRGGGAHVDIGDAHADIGGVSHLGSDAHSTATPLPPPPAAVPDSLVLVLEVNPRLCRPPLLPTQLASAAHLGGDAVRGRPRVLRVHASLAAALRPGDELLSVGMVKSAALVAPPLTAPASRGGLSRLLAALHTRAELLRAQWIAAVRP